MRDGSCPKCGGRRIATTKLVVYVGGGVSGPTVDFYVCAQCKYCEQFMVGSVEERVSVLDSWSWVQREEGGPFRG